MRPSRRTSKASTAASLRRPHSNILGRIVPTHFAVARSVCLLSVCRLSHSCTLLKPFDGFRCHLAATPAGSSDTLCWTGVPDPSGKVEICGLNRQAKHAIASSNLRKKMIYDSSGGCIDQRFRLLPNYFGGCYLFSISQFLPCTRKWRTFRFLLPYRGVQSFTPSL